MPTRSSGRLSRDAVLEFLAEAGLAVSSPVLSEEFQQNFTAEQNQAIEEKISIPAEELIPGLPFIIVGISVVLIALLVFGNPLKKK